MSSHVLVLLLPWIAALIATPLCMRFAQARQWVDRPGPRKRHARPVPYLGGVAVFAAVLLGLLAAAPFVPAVREAGAGLVSLGAVGLGAACMVALGAWDDLRELSHTSRLLVEVGVAVATWLAGFRIGAVELPFGWLIADAALPSLLLSVGWIVLLTNAFNLIDGLDGLATGIAICAALTLYLLASGNREAVSGVGALALAGALAGFLRFNLPPARIFLGDAGALAIGYSVAVFSIVSFQKSSTALVLAVPLLVVGVPMLDTAGAIVRRVSAHLRLHGARGLAPAGLGRALFRADRDHIHFLLLRAGVSVRGVLFLLYAISGALAGLALWIHETGSTVRWGAVALIGLAASLLVVLLERRVERRERVACAVGVAVSEPERVAAEGRR